MVNKSLLQQAFNATGDDFEEWYKANVVEFTCIDCEEEIVRPRNDWLDIDGITPQRCGSCTLDRMAEQKTVY